VDFGSFRELWPPSKLHPPPLPGSEGNNDIHEHRGVTMIAVLRELLLDDSGQDIAEYAVMLAVILVIVVGTLRLIGSNANNVFSATASSIK
jgi:Flp pilus assembly pilin Flp